MLPTVVLAFALAACGTDDATPAAGPPVRLACLSIRAPDCQSVATTVMERVTGPGAIVAVTVEAYPCDVGQCPAGFEERHELAIVVELESPARIRQFGATTMFTGRMTVDAGIDTTSVEVKPTSQRATAEISPFATGHCGLWSPIDFDGSLWDAIGDIDGRHAAAINGTSGKMVLTGATTARFESDAGLAVNLLRREGSKSFRGCD